ncbi:MAG TPA: DNA cytosine methyltransferase [Oscillatoriaceae cyanobacterium M33_DOE_052]|uniref:DNA cytosine methyltransferase n=1 Tax=Planktothricoides sp. SpSt-374 TaxID=2282167 RepID=A0A7C3VSP1_9CYAN|nr:DNA cytosine methyltransferase [Oscillatoriaceae cyanobacterium M33_DOE_052]
MIPIVAPPKAIALSTSPQFRLIDLFAGAGGFTLGFTAPGSFQPVWAVDNNQYAVATYKLAILRLLY